MFHFTSLMMSENPVYQSILDVGKSGQTWFMDLGCCLGQEIRKLVFDGAPSANTYGSDLWGGFFTVGYELFNDKDRLQTTFIAADVFDDASPLVELAGQMNIVYTGDLFHLFDLEDQERIATRVIQLLAPQPGSMVVGRQSGSETPGAYSRAGDTRPWVMAAARTRATIAATKREAKRLTRRMGRGFLSGRENSLGSVPGTLSPPLLGETRALTWSGE